MTFRLKRSTKLKKLMESYCAREGKNIKHCKFTFDGERIREDHTPEEVICPIHRLINIRPVLVGYATR